MVVEIKDNQCIIDIAIQYYGSVAGLGILCEDNGLRPDQVLSKGNTLIIRENEVVDKRVKSIIDRASKIVATGQQITPPDGLFLVTEWLDNIVDENGNLIVFA